MTGRGNSGAGIARPPAVAAAVLLAFTAPALAGADVVRAEGEVVIHITGLRSARGDVHVCMAPSPSEFPDCRDPAAGYRATVPASAPGAIAFEDVPPGRYAIAMLHDENRNGKADKALALIPREGFGFSRDAPVRLGPPSFRQASFAVNGDVVRQTIRMRYLM